MSDRLSLSQVAALMTFAAAMAGGQLLFKMAALRGAGDGPLAERIAGFLLNGYFFVALILYAALTVLWVWILSFTPLSRAYPFLALAFALTPALGCLVFAEPLSMRLVTGIVLILGGLFFIAG
jgi:drug/metabolite transporter (DMT)-like permease